MLAAHRNGGRIDLASFARSWDRYTDADEPRPATPRELRTLVALLESSLADRIPVDGTKPAPPDASGPPRAARARRPDLPDPAPASRRRVVGVTEPRRPAGVA